MRETEVKVYYQGSAKFNTNGYLVAGNDEVVAFYIDPYERTIVDGFSNTIDNIPTILCQPSEDENSPYTEVGFPEFVGWDVHSVQAGKTISVCLVNREKIFKRYENEMMVAECTMNNLSSP